MLNFIKRFRNPIYTSSASRGGLASKPLKMLCVMDNNITLSKFRLTFEDGAYICARQDAFLKIRQA